MLRKSSLTLVSRSLNLSLLSRPHLGPTRVQTVFWRLFRDRSLEANLLALVNFPRQSHGRFQEVLRLNKRHHQLQKTSARSSNTLPKYVALEVEKAKSCSDYLRYNPRSMFENKIEFVAKLEFQFVLNAPRKPFFDYIE